MASQDGTRAVVQDPLAPNPRAQNPDRSLQLGKVHTPNTPSADSLTPHDGLAQALTGVEGILQTEFEKKKDDWITEGKVAYQSGATEQQMLATGNAFTAQGYHTLQSRDTVNQWFTTQSIAIDEKDKQLDPHAYGQQLKQQRTTILSGITDPDARKVASAAFEDMSPRLASAQAVKNNEYNRGQRINAFSTTLASTGPTSATASTKSDPNQPLALSPIPVEAVMQPSARDRDVGIRTMLGEAANEGADGLAAVAHVMRNRTTDSRWPDSIAGVALQPKQFSTNNSGAGGNGGGSQYPVGSSIYERAGQVFDAVMSGKHVDPTGGATHYYSPAGMTALVAEGSQSNVIPKWLDDETARGGGRIKIGGHIFVGKAAPDAERASVAPQVTATTIAAGTPGDLNAVPAKEDVGVTGIAQSKGANEVQQLIHGYTGLNNEDKATAVADAMRRGLDAGDDTLFRDAGGVSVLHSLNAKPNEVDEVIKAQKRFNDKSETSFSVARAKYEDDIIKRAQNGEDINSIFADIDKTHKAGLLNDASSRTLAASAAEKVRTANGEKSQLGNPDMLNELSGIYQQIATGTDPMKLAGQAQAVAKKYGATEKDVTHIVSKMFSDNQSSLNTLREKAATEAKLKLEQDGIKATVARALAQGNGAANLTGTVKTPNDAGQPINMPASDYAVEQIKDKWGKQYSDAIAQGKLTKEQAQPEMERKVFLELQQQGLIDKKQQAQLQGGLAGNIVDKDGSVKVGASQAYNTWLTLKNTPGISDAYLTKFVGDDSTRNLLEHAFLLDAGDLSKDQALLKAHEILNDPNRDPNDKINKDAIWKQKLSVDMPKTLMARTDPGFFNRLFGTYDRSERERLLTNDKTAENYVNARADAYHFQNPNEFGEVSLTKALQDLQAHSVPVMGNLIITKPGQELDKMMGVDGFGPNAAEDAIKGYLTKNGEKIWGKSYTDRAPSNLLSNISQADKQFSPQGIAQAVAPGTFDDAANYKGEHAKTPPMRITYDQSLGIMTVDLYKDKDMKQTLGSPKHFNVKSIGAEYAKEQNTPGTWTNTWNAINAAPAKAVHDIQDWSYTVGSNPRPK